MFRKKKAELLGTKLG